MLLPCVLSCVRNCRLGHRMGRRKGRHCGNCLRYCRVFCKVSCRWFETRRCLRRRWQAFHQRRSCCRSVCCVLVLHRRACVCKARLVFPYSFMLCALRCVADASAGPTKVLRITDLPAAPSAQLAYLLERESELKSQLNCAFQLRLQLQSQVWGT
jgi:hypothetical protein